MLPHGFTSRSATIDDADAIYKLMAAGEIRWHGQYVEQLAVRSDQRGKGVARAMLDVTCAEFYRLGRRDCILWTHSGTGALGMYERLGMRVRRSTTVHRSTR